MKTDLRNDRRWLSWEKFSCSRTQGWKMSLLLGQWAITKQQYRVVTQSLSTLPKTSGSRLCNLEQKRIPSKSVFRYVTHSGGQPLFYKVLGNLAIAANTISLIPINLLKMKTPLLSPEIYKNRSQFRFSLVSCGGQTNLLLPYIIIVTTRYCFFFNAHILAIYKIMCLSHSNNTKSTDYVRHNVWPTNKSNGIRQKISRGIGNRRKLKLIEEGKVTEVWVAFCDRDADWSVNIEWLLGLTCAEKKRNWKWDKRGTLTQKAAKMFYGKKIKRCGHELRRWLWWFPPLLYPRWLLPTYLRDPSRCTQIRSVIIF